MSFINKLNQNLPGFLLHIPNRLQGNMMKPKRIISGIDDVVPPVVPPVVKELPTFVSWSDGLTDPVTVELNDEFNIPTALFNDNTGNFTVYPSIISRNINTYYNTTLIANDTLSITMIANVKNTQGW